MKKRIILTICFSIVFSLQVYAEIDKIPTVPENMQTVKIETVQKQIKQNSDEKEKIEKEYYQLCEKANIFAEKKKYKRAFLLLDKAIILNPDLPKAYVLKAEINKNNKQYAEAEKYAKKALQIDENNAIANNVMGIYYEIEKEDYNNAIKYYTKAIESDPKYIKPLNNRCYIYASKLNKINLAKKDAQAIIQIPVQTSNDYRTKSYAYYVLEQYEKALENINIAIQLNPKETEYYLKRALLYTNLNNPHKALLDINRVLKKKPTDCSAIITKIIIYEQMKSSKSLILKELKSAKQYATKDFEKIYIAKAYRDYGYNDDAMAIVNEMLESDANNIDALGLKIALKINLEKYDEALKICENIEQNNIKNTFDEDILLYKAEAKLGIAGDVLKDNWDQAKKLTESAISDLNIVIKRNANPYILAKAYLYRGSANAELTGRNVEQAYTDLEKCISYNALTKKDIILALYQLAFSNTDLYNQKSINAVINIYINILEVDPTEYAALLNIVLLSDVDDVSIDDVNKLLNLMNNKSIPIGNVSVDARSQKYVISPYKNALGKKADGEGKQEIKDLKFILLMKSDKYNVVQNLKDFLNTEGIYSNEVYIYDFKEKYKDTDVISKDVLHLLINDLQNNSTSKAMSTNTKNLLRYFLVYLADLYMDDNNTETAVHYYEEATKYGWKQSVAYKVIADCYYDNHDISQAKHYYEKAIKAGANKSDIYKLLAAYYYENNNKLEAINYLTKALNAKRDYLLFEIRGDIRCELGDYGSAMADYNNSLKLKPTASVYFKRASMLFDQRLYASAFNDYLKASAYDKNDAASIYNAAMCKYNLGKKQDALPYLERAKNLYQKQANREGYNSCVRYINHIKGYRR